ncbi:hypothetical protein [Xylanimonas protaetiae]|uniref:Uncharacterized protein n=1 Tax=Xylanimonas protaetiae TaxID=2509457 RepID=A0A4P6F300_9MICO|nr:hypothetical protein [Xylanimonas protaetiae]QAY69894.1 hypothetical protein ET471_07490 [Xylanimonas protaetiae]
MSVGAAGVSVTGGGVGSGGGGGASTVIVTGVLVAPGTFGMTSCAVNSPGATVPCPVVQDPAADGLPFQRIESCRTSPGPSSRSRVVAPQCALDQTVAPAASVITSWREASPPFTRHGRRPELVIDRSKLTRAPGCTLVASGLATSVRLVAGHTWLGPPTAAGSGAATLSAPSGGTGSGHASRTQPTPCPMP